MRQRGIWTAGQTWQSVVVADSFHNSVLWFPNEEWMKLKVFWWWQLIDRINKFWLRWVTPQGDHVHWMSHRSRTWPQSQGFHFCFHPDSLLLRAVPSAHILIIAWQWWNSMLLLQLSWGVPSRGCRGSWGRSRGCRLCRGHWEEGYRMTC